MKEKQTTELSVQPSEYIKLAITNENTDVAKLKELLEMQRQWEERQAQKLFAKDFVIVRPKLPLIIRSKENKQTGSRYAALEDVNKIVDPILSKHGFATSTKILAQTDTSVTIEALLWHSGGHIERTSITLPLDDKGMQGAVNKTKIHGTSSTVTYGKRIAICALLNISTGDDVDGNKSEKAFKEETQDELKKRISEAMSRIELTKIWKQNLKLQKEPWFENAVQEQTKKVTEKKVDLP